MEEDRNFTSVSLSLNLLAEVKKTIEAKKAKEGGALLPPEFKSVSAFIAEATRKELAQLRSEEA